MITVMLCQQKQLGAHVYRGTQNKAQAQIGAGAGLPISLVVRMLPGVVLAVSLQHNTLPQVTGDSVPHTAPAGLFYFEKAEGTSQVNSRPAKLMWR